MTCYDLAGEIGTRQKIDCELDAAPALDAELDLSGYGGGAGYNIGHGLKLDRQTNTLSVDTAEAVEQNNTLPVTSAAVYTTVGNIEVILGTI